MSRPAEKAALDLGHCVGAASEVPRAPTASRPLGHYLILRRDVTGDIVIEAEARAEIPTRADASLVAYRRWLKEKGITYGTAERAA